MSFNKRFYSFLGTITLVRLIYAIILPLAPQEAYYWNYSRHPALSYFDHPPMASYVIRLTTLLGTSAFSIHLAAILISIVMTIAIYRLASLLFDEWVGFWSAVVINLVFIYALGALIITPDNPMLLFWVLSMIACIKIDRGERPVWWLLLGIFIGAGFVSKYPIVFAGFGALLFFLSSRERRRWFTTPWPYISLLAAFVVALPVIYWNYTHNWASFVFQTSRRAGEMSQFRFDYFFGYIGTILGIYGFIPIPLLVAGMWSSLKNVIKTKAANQTLLVVFSLPLVLFLLPVATRSWVKMNWTAPAFIGWFIAAVAYYRANAPGQRWIRVWGKVGMAFLLVSIVVIHILAPLPGLYLGKGDYYAGWKDLAGGIESIRAEMPMPCFIAGSEYKISSELAFYLKGHPETVGANVIGQPALQYDYWANPDTLLGYNGIYISDCSNCPGFTDELKQYFKHVSEPLVFPIKKGGKKVRDYYIYLCYNYTGKGR
jgi:4-amino-4-deoxy-L-arabinose transferase-like glycosyltransferase